MGPWELHAAGRGGCEGLRAPKTSARDHTHLAVLGAAPCVQAAVARHARGVVASAAGHASQPVALSRSLLACSRGGGGGRSHFLDFAGPRELHQFVRGQGESGIWPLKRRLSKESTPWRSRMPSPSWVSVREARGRGVLEEGHACERSGQLRGACCGCGGGAAASRRATPHWTAPPLAPRAAGGVRCGERRDTGRGGTDVLCLSIWTLSLQRRQRDSWRWVTTSWGGGGPGVRAGTRVRKHEDRLGGEREDTASRGRQRECLGAVAAQHAPRAGRRPVACVCVCVCVCACMRACMRGPALDIAAGAVD